MSESVRTGLASQFGTWNHADVCIRFHLERSPEQQQEERQNEEDGDRACASGRQFVGDPLPAHTVILILASPFLKARLEKACWQRMAAGAQVRDGVAADDAFVVHLDKRQRVEGVPKGMANGSEGGCDSEAASALPEVLVPLSSEAEEPFARQAIEYIYTGSLSADLGFEALLRVRQQACYLDIEHCPQACDQAMLAWLQAGAEQGQQQQQDGAGLSTGTEAAPAVLQAYACHLLFPEAGTDGEQADFSTVRSALARQLVSHFVDAVAALTQPHLYRQLLQLPAVAMRELLAADDFGTDSEDSVFLLLACWLDAHTGEEGKEEAVSAATRAELCGLVRLHRLSSTYLQHVLPVYKPVTISRAELDFLLRYIGADAKEKEDMLNVDPQRRLSPWYCSPARRQVVRERGRTVEWSISREQLEQGLREMLKSKKSAHVTASFGTFAASCTKKHPAWVLSCGLLFRVVMRLAPAVVDFPSDDGAARPGAAGIWVGCNVSRLYGKVTGSVTVDARVAARNPGVAAWKRRRSLSMDFGSGHGWVRSLGLQPAAPAAVGTAGGSGRGGAAAAAAATTAAAPAGAGSGRDGGGGAVGTSVASAGAGSSSGGGGAADAGAGGGGGNGGGTGEQQPSQQQEKGQLQQLQLQGHGHGHGQQEQEQGQQQEQEPAEAQVAAQLARFSQWLHDGKISGSITFYRP